MTLPGSALRLKAPTRSLDGYAALLPLETRLEDVPDTTTEEYAHDQSEVNIRVTREFLEPLARRVSASTILDVGCGVGKSVVTLIEDGFDAYGVDLPGLTKHWAALDLPRDRFFVAHPGTFELPFEDDSLDFAYSFGVLEHVGTHDGHATRAPDYHDARRRWLREIFRVVKPRGSLLMGGPNRNCPVDFSHGLDASANAAERWLSRRVGRSIHRPWGEYFLWGYPDFERYLQGLEFELEPLSIRGLLQFGRVPRPLRGLARLYIEHLPRVLWGTGCNPWVMALIRKVRSGA